MSTKLVTEGTSVALNGKEYLYVAGMWYCDNMAAPTKIFPTLNKLALSGDSKPSDTTDKPATKVSGFTPIKEVDGKKIGVFFINPTTANKPGDPHYRGMMVAGDVTITIAGWKIMDQTDKATGHVNLAFQSTDRKTAKLGTLYFGPCVVSPAKKANRTSDKSPTHYGRITVFNSATMEFERISVSGWTAGTMLNMSLSKPAEKPATE